MLAIIMSMGILLTAAISSGRISFKVWGTATAICSRVLNYQPKRIPIQFKVNLSVSNLIKTNVVYFTTDRVTSVGMAALKEHCKWFKLF